jgi:hypothetical protein
METTTYKGVKTTIPNLLLDPIIKEVNPPKASTKFGSKSLYYNGRYYFFEDIRTTDKVERINDGKPFEIQVVYYSHKWYQDTCYITEDFKNLLLKHKF